MMRPDAKVEKVYLYPKPVDFRKSIDGLAALVELDIKVAVFDPVLFVFLNSPCQEKKENKMRDEHFAEFIECFGEATHRTPTPESSVAKWENHLPPILIEYWKNEGWASYANGLLWTVNPDDFEHLKDAWLENTPLESFDKFHVIARSAFGNLYLCGERTGRSVTITCNQNEILALKNRLKPKTLDAQNLTVQSLFGASDPEDFDMPDSNGKLLFNRALKSCGPLQPDELYGFEPALVLGGTPTLKNLRRLKLDQHLLILRSFVTPTLPFSSIDIEGLTN